MSEEDEPNIMEELSSWRWPRATLKPKIKVAIIKQKPKTPSDSSVGS